jgi:hypothetical protein
LRASGYNERWLNYADVADAADKGGLLRVAHEPVQPTVLLYLLLSRS